MKFKERLKQNKKSRLVECCQKIFRARWKQEKKNRPKICCVFFDFNKIWEFSSMLHATPNLWFARRRADWRQLWVVPIDDLCLKKAKDGKHRRTDGGSFVFLFAKCERRAWWTRVGQNRLNLLFLRSEQFQAVIDKFLWYLSMKLNFWTSSHFICFPQSTNELILTEMTFLQPDFSLSGFIQLQ